MTPNVNSKADGVARRGCFNDHPQLVGALRAILEERDQQVFDAEAGRRPRPSKLGAGQSDWRLLLAAVSARLEASSRCDEDSSGEWVEGENDLHASRQDMSVASLFNIPGATLSADPPKELWLATEHAAALVSDALRFAVDSVVMQVWPWPLQTVNGNATGLEARLDSTHRSHASQHGGLAGLSLLGFLQEAGRSVSDMLPSTARTSVQVLGRACSDSAGIVRQPLQSLIGVFLERHPEHRAFVGNRDPILVVLLIFALLHLMAWELYGLWRLTVWFVTTILCCPCRWPQKDSCSEFVSEASVFEGTSRPRSNCSKSPSIGRSSPSKLTWQNSCQADKENWNMVNASPYKKAQWSGCA